MDRLLMMGNVLMIMINGEWQILAKVFIDVLYSIRYNV